MIFVANVELWDFTINKGGVTNCIDKAIKAFKVTPAMVLMLRTLIPMGLEDIVYT
jgi:hypothetical protein